MVTSFQHKGLELMHEGNPKRINSDLRKRCQSILTALNVASLIEEMDLPGLELHELKGDRKGTWAVKVNKNWRITFQFAEGNASDVNLEDYH